MYAKAYVYVYSIMSIYSWLWDYNEALALYIFWEMEQFLEHSIMPYNWGEGA